MEFAPPGDQYINNMIGGQITGGSTSVRDGWEKLRKAGATARHLLVSAAAAEWGIDARNCRVDDGVIISPQLKKLKFGEVAEAAVQTTRPEGRAAQARGEFTLIGKAQRRKDTPAKVDGSAIYGIDVKLPDMLYAALAQPPTLGGSVKTFNDEKARAMPGVHRHGAHLFAASPWSPIPGGGRARRAISCRSNGMPARTRALNDAKIAQTLRKGAAGDGRVARHDGDAAAAIKGARAWCAPTTNCRCSRTPRSSRRTALPTCARTAPTSTCRRRFSRSRRPRRPRPPGSIPSR